jgi:hypothetical protein
MRIICDHCSFPISGTVKRVAGNFNLHPDCLAQLSKEAKHDSTGVSCRNQEPSVGTLVEWKGTVPGVSREM